MESTLERLSLKDTRKGPLLKSKEKTKPPVADSWEEDDDSEGTETEPTSRSSEIPDAPPPTPASPNSSAFSGWPTEQEYPRTDSVPYGARYVPSQSRGPSEAPSSRPEKQTAVAGRLIAGALGVRAPKKTDEQRAYDKAVKEKELKRRNKAREDEARAREEEEKAKAAVWDG